MNYHVTTGVVLGDLIIPADSSSTSLGIGLSITLKAGVKLLRWLWGAVTQWLEHLQLKQELGPGFNPGRLPSVFFSFPAGSVTNVDAYTIQYRNTAFSQN